MRFSAAAVLALLAVGSRGEAAPLKPIRSSIGTIPLARMLATAETVGQWRLLNGNGDLRLMRVMSREGGECGVSDLDDANNCPRYRLFVILNGEYSGPVQFTAFQLPETLGWALPMDFTPDENSERTAIPLRACELSRTPKGFGWRGVSYELHVTQKVGASGFLFSASLNRLPGQRVDCADSQ